jgi:DNA-binding transcriptional ArsR family regulator
MVAFQLSPDMFGHTRFNFSPLAELGSALVLFDQPARAGIHRRWLLHARTATQDVDLRLLTALCPDRPWLPSFIYRAADETHATIESQLARLEQDGVDAMADEMAIVWGQDPIPDVLTDTLRQGAAGLRRITTALDGFWRRAVEPYWSAIESVLEDDVSHRAGRIVSGGMYSLLEDIHPETTIDGDLFRINKPHHADQNTINGCRRLTLVPSVFSYPKLIIDHDESEHLVVVYGARGVGRTWEGLSRGRQLADTPVDDHLAALLGRTRSAILTRLDVPMTTTQLAAEFDQSASTISEHLACLRAAGLLTAWRSGRRVFYRQTALAGSLITASGAGRLQQVN